MVAGTAAAGPRYEIDATLDPDEGLVEGTVVLHADASPGGTGDSRLLLWLYPQRFADAPEALDERNARWIYPCGVDEGGLEITACRTASGTDCALEYGEDGRTVWLTPDGEGPAEATLRFRTRVPERFGLFGRDGDVMVLGGGWHPLLAGRDSDGRFDPEEPIERADYAVTLHVASGWSLIVDGTGPYRCGEEHVAGCRVEHASEAGEPPSVLVAPDWHERSVSAAGVRLRLCSTEPTRAPSSYAVRGGVGLDPESVPDPWSVDRMGWLLGVLSGALRDLDDEQLLPPPERRPSEVMLVVVPLRLAAAGGVSGTVLVSDQAYHIFPIEPFFRFQDAEILREVLAQLDLGGLAARPLAEARWTAELIAAAAVERLAERAGEAGRRAEDWLKYGAFVPVIDQMIFAPLMQFRDAYYASIEESDSLRDELWRFSTQLPRGKRLWAKLRDRLGADAARTAVREILATGAPLEQASARAAADELAGFRETWLGRYPPVNLRLGAWGSEPLADGTWRTTVRLRRDGDPTAREFVTVRVRLADGTERDERWNSAEPDGEVSFVADAPATDVELDPESRVVQDPTLTDNHPRADDVSSLPWRLPVLDKFRVSLDLAEIENSELDIDFSMRRRYDLHQLFRARFTRDVRGIGGSFGYLYGFGPPRDMNRPSWSASGYLEVFHYDEAFGGAAGSSATTMELGGYVSHDDRWFDLNPGDGWQGLLGLAGSFPLDDSGAWTVRLAGRAFYLWSPGLGHTLALYGGFGLTFGQPVEAQLEALGDRMLLAALSPDEALGRAKLFVVAEYRHLFTWDLDVNLFHIVWLRGLQGVLFAGAGTSSRRATGDGDVLDGLFAEDRVYFEAGYGLRAFLDWAGVQTALIALDLAVPFAIVDGAFGVPQRIKPDPGDSDTWRRRPALFGLPFAAHLSFTQTF